MSEMKESTWSQLLALMERGDVVPVVGARLLLDADGKSSLQARVAERLLIDHEVELPEGGLTPFREVNEAVALLKGTVDAQDLYYPIFQAMVDLLKQGVKIPRPLQQLAQITDFRLMITLTPDDLLARALVQARRPFSEIVHSPKLPTDQVADLPPDWDPSLGDVQLLYMFGKAAPGPLFSIHDEDMLEHAHNIIASGSHTPKAFLGALQDRSLLLIGCNFPDWLSRFMLRATRKGRLAVREGRRGWLVEPLARQDPFIGFLGSYSPETSVLSSVDPAQFVDELHRRWLALRTPTAGEAPVAPAEPPLPETAMFFISYSRTTDLPQAQRLFEALRGLGVGEHEIWFDRKTLEPGDNFRQRILDGIRGCRYFLPVVSHAATRRDEAFVFQEWETATARLPRLSRRFMLPLVVDAQMQPEGYKQLSVQNWVERDINFAHAPEGTPDAHTLATLTKLVQQARDAD
jgi:hypothetical protein